MNPRSAGKVILTPRGHIILQQAQLSPRQRVRRALLELLPKRSIGAEIGVSHGDFSQEMLDIVHPKKLVLIDPWDLLGERAPEASTKWFLDAEQMRKTHQGVVRRFAHNAAVKVVRGFSEDCLLKFDDSHFDWVYIDAAHEYQAVRAELQHCIQKVKLGGFITGDDLFKSDGDRKGVKDAVLDTLADCGLPRKLDVLNRDAPPAHVDLPSRIGQQFIIPVTEKMKQTVW